MNADVRLRAGRPPAPDGFHVGRRVIGTVRDQPADRRFADAVAVVARPAGALAVVVGPAQRQDGQAGSSESFGGFAVGGAVVSPHVSDAGRVDDLRERLTELAAAVDLREPFERIRAAIEEAQRH
jgi:hypothetical protein